jgi:anti-sigma regulatory factor (Ser/Thr protein kinase)
VRRPKPDIRIELPGAFVLRQRRFERMIRLLRPILELDASAVIEVDLSRLVSVGPAALALLIAALRRVDDAELFADGSILLPPNSPPVAYYLMRMNLVRSLAGGEELPEPITRGEAHGFRPCAMFSDDTDYWQVAKGLTEALAESCTTDDVARAAVRVCLDEIAENVVQHAQAAHGFGAAQGWLRSCEFEIGMVDLGRGIRASLTANPTYADIKDDALAISTALGPRVTATPERNSGVGLYITRMLLAANGGSLLVRSGNGAVYSGSTEEVRTEPETMPGTLVALRARTDRPLDINAVYQQLEHDHPDPPSDDD